MRDGGVRTGVCIEVTVEDTKRFEAIVARVVLLRDMFGDPKPFAWKADPDEMIVAVRGGHQTLEAIH